jgi:hypothetical protein
MAASDAGPDPGRDERWAGDTPLPAAPLCIRQRRRPITSADLRQFVSGSVRARTRRDHPKRSALNDHAPSWYRLSDLKPASFSPIVPSRFRRLGVDRARRQPICGRTEHRRSFPGISSRISSLSVRLAGRTGIGPSVLTGAYPETAIPILCRVAMRAPTRLRSVEPTARLHR